MNLFENLQTMKEEQTVLDSIESTKIFISNNLKNINNKPFENILREILFSANIDWKDVQLIINKYMPEIKIESLIENKNSIDNYFDNLINKIQNKFNCDIDDTYYDIDNYPSEFKARFVIYNIGVNQADDIEKIIIKEISKDYNDVKVDYEWDNTYLSNFVKDAYVYTIQAYNNSVDSWDF